MSVLVGSCIWSTALRRSVATPEAATLGRLALEGRLVMVGPIRQEVLSGVRAVEQYQRLLKLLAPFNDQPVEQGDYEAAALLQFECRSKGVQGSNVDFLLCAFCIRTGVELYTNDQDFLRFQQVRTFKLFDPATV